MYYDEEFSFRSNLLSFNVLQNEEEVEFEFGELDGLSETEEIVNEDTMNENYFRNVFNLLVADQMYFLNTFEHKTDEMTLKMVSIDLRIFIEKNIDSFINMLKMHNMCNAVELKKIVRLVGQVCNCILVTIICSVREENECSQLSLEQQHILSEKKLNIDKETRQIHQDLFGDPIITEEKLKDSVRRLTSVFCEIDNINF